MAAAGFALALASGPAACAHDVKEMTAWARVFTDRVEIVVTISAHMAAVLLAKPNEPAVEVTPGTVATFRERLEAEGKMFCTLRSGAKDALAPTSLV